MANGTNRRRSILGLKDDDVSKRTGEQFETNVITDKANQTGTNKFLPGRSTTEFEQRDTIDPDIRKRFRESPGFFAKEDVEKTSAQLIKEREQAGVSAIAGTQRLRPTTTQRAVEQGDVEQQDLTKLKRGESIGNLTIGRQTAAEENQRKFGVGKKGKPSVFSQAGIRDLFGSARDLAKIFSSTEFQERKAKGIRSGIAAKGRQADVKATNEKIKTLGDLRSSLIESGEPEDSDIIKRIDQQLLGAFQGTDAGESSQKIGVLGKLLKLGPLTKEQEQLFTGA